MSAKIIIHKGDTLHHNGRPCVVARFGLGDFIGDPAPIYVTYVDGKDPIQGHGLFPEDFDEFKKEPLKPMGMLSPQYDWNCREVENGPLCLVVDALAYGKHRRNETLEEVAAIFDAKAVATLAAYDALTANEKAWSDKPATAGGYKDAAKIIRLMKDLS